MDSLHPYDDIIDLPHHQSPRRAHMPREDRAAQFAPFAALRGYDDVLLETQRLTQPEVQLAEDEQNLLDRALRRIREALPSGPLVCLTYYAQDSLKPGGVYLEKTGRVRKIDPLEKRLIFEDGDAVYWQTVRRCRIEDHSHAAQKQESNGRELQ